jgi:hypothetical protein
MDKVVERFYRISESSANGCDSRLAIVNEIAAQIFLELI